jgi:hypothetical protein
MTHGLFPIEMFCCIIVEILLILETKLQSCQVLTNKPTELKMGCLCASISTRWYLRIVYCDSSSQNFDSGVDIHVSYGNGLTGTLIAVTVCSPIERSKLIVSAK